MIQIHPFAFHKVFSSHMVLQRDKPIVFSGTAEKAGQIAVTFNNQTIVTLVDTNNEWKAAFPALPAGGPFAVTATALETGTSVCLDDVLVGDVWMCSGQSNMQMPIWSTNPHFCTLNWEEELKQANHPRIRIFNGHESPRVAPKAPVYDLDISGWRVCTPENVRNFSACAYFFGRQLQKDLDIPIGLVATAWGGTDIASWISRDKMDQCGWKPYSIADEPDEDQITDSWNAYMASDAGKALAAWCDQFDRECAYSTEVAAEDYDDSQWTVANGSPDVPAPGRYAHRVVFDLPECLAGQAFKVCLGKIDDADTTYMNGVKLGRTSVETPAYWGVPRIYQVPEKLAHAGRNVITVIHDDQYNIGVCCLGIFTIKVGEEEISVDARVRTTCLHMLPEGFPPRPTISFHGASSARDEGGPNAPNTLYNARIAPWLRYAFKGVIWYQGCHNNGQLSYYQLHKMLIENWREKWNEPDMPFLVVQLAAFHRHTPDKPMSDAEVDAIPLVAYPPYAITREIQAQLQEEYRNVATVVSFDIGDASDVHPSDKQTLGYRLARRAEKMLFDESILADGPVFDGMRIEKDKVRVFFRNTGSGLTTSDGKAPLAFVLADRTGGLHPADAAIEGNTVVVSSPYVPEPEGVRYAFTSFCHVNLRNKEGYPAMPFRSDGIDYRRMLAF